MSKNLYTGLNITSLTGDTNSLVVDTNSLVVHSGNTGIGVAAPTAKLQVDGDVTFDFANGETLTINQTNSNVGLTTTATNAFVWENAGKTVIKAQTISSTGRVGIGAEAFGGIAAGVHAFSETDGTTIPHFRVSDSANNGKFVVWGNGRFDFLGGSSDLRLRTNADGKIRLTTVYDGNHYLTITDDTPTVIHKLYTGGGRAGDVNLAITGGDVGIGFTGNPNGKLHVVGPGDLASNIGLLVENSSGKDMFQVSGLDVEVFAGATPLVKFRDDIDGGGLANIFIYGKNPSANGGSVIRIDNVLSSNVTTLQVNNTGANNNSALYVNKTNGGTGIGQDVAIQVQDGDIYMSPTNKGIIYMGQNSPRTHMLNLNVGAMTTTKKGVYIQNQQSTTTEVIGYEALLSGAVNSGGSDLYGLKINTQTSSASTVYAGWFNFGTTTQTNADTYGIYSQYAGHGASISSTSTHRAGYFRIKPTSGSGSQSFNTLYGTDVLAGLNQATMSATTMTGSRILFSNTTGGNIGTAVGLEVDMGNTSSVATNYYAATFEGGNVGIGTGTPDSTAALDVTSTTQGFLPPRMTGAQAEAISSPATGLMVYATSAGSGDITTAGWWGYNGSNWIQLG